MTVKNASFQGEHSEVAGTAVFAEWANRDSRYETLNQQSKMFIVFQLMRGSRTSQMMSQMSVALCRSFIFTKEWQTTVEISLLFLLFYKMYSSGSI